MLQKDILDYHEQTKNANKTARHFGISPQAVRRALITNGLYLSERNKEVTRLRLIGFTTEEIANYLRISEKTSKATTPTPRGVTSPKSGQRTRLKLPQAEQRKRPRHLKR